MSDATDRADELHLTFGDTVYDEKGRAVGSIRGFDEHGFYVSLDDGIESLSGEHITAGLPGEGELMWRCWECGAMGEIEDIPETCPDCGAPKEDIYYWTED
ncbi:MAG: rubredoxin-like domain-containing protein [Haloarculaceae archaeon]